VSDGREPKLRNGQHLAHYRIEEPIGEGAMGVVYRAHDTALDRPVAVKVLKPRVAEDEALVARFFREARAAARVNHEHLTHIYFVGEEEGAHFFAMELLPGENLDDYVKAYGPLSWAKALRVLVQTANGLAAAHAAGVVHRDVKPSNIILLEDGRAKVTDFGLAKSLHADVHATQAGALMGTPTYMSPEQCRGGDVDARTDVYALGLTAWYLLMGKAPYPGGSLGDMLDRQMNEPLPSLRDERPELPRELDEALRRMCEKDPEKRPQDMHEVARMLTECMPGELHGAGLFTRGVALAIDAGITGLLVTLTWLLAAVDLDAQRHGALALAFWWTLTQLGMEAWRRQSIGKWLLDLYVVKADGGRPAFRTLLLRYLIRFPAVIGWTVGGLLLPADYLIGIDLLSVAAVLGALGVWAYTRYRDPPARTLSDLWTRTRVAYRIRSERGS